MRSHRWALTAGRLCPCPTSVTGRAGRLAKHAAGAAAQMAGCLPDDARQMAAGLAGWCVCRRWAPGCGGPTVDCAREAAARVHAGAVVVGVLHAFLQLHRGVSASEFRRGASPPCVGPVQPFAGSLAGRVMTVQARCCCPGRCLPHLSRLLAAATSPAGATHRPPTQLVLCDHTVQALFRLE
jgi:hypothetical protein